MNRSEFLNVKENHSLVLMLLATAFSLYISVAIVCSCNVVVGNSWFGRTGPSAAFEMDRNSTTSNHNWSGLD